VKVTFSPAAQADLMEIAMFIAQDNPARVLTFVDELEGKCDALGTWCVCRSQVHRFDRID
jgi:toxin ParE1/3/4